MDKLLESIIINPYLYILIEILIVGKIWGDNLGVDKINDAQFIAAVLIIVFVPCLICWTLDKILNNEEEPSA